LEQIAREHKQPLLLQGFPGVWTFLFTSKRKVVNHAEARGSDYARSKRFSQLLAQRGVIAVRRFYTSAAHTEKDVGDALDRANEAMRQLREESVRSQ